MTGISLRDIEIEMLVTAWYPHVFFFKLSFGTQDKISSALQLILPQDDDQDFFILQQNARTYVNTLIFMAKY